MTLLPDPPADRTDALAVELWLALFDRWFAAMEQSHRRDEIDAGRRWIAERATKKVGA